MKIKTFRSSEMLEIRVLWCIAVWAIVGFAAWPLMAPLTAWCMLAWAWGLYEHAEFGHDSPRHLPQYTVDHAGIKSRTYPEQWWYDVRGPKGLSRGDVMIKLYDAPTQHADADTATDEEDDTERARRLTG
jgi:hypothetical protein